ncbi:hypothetical protein NIES2107_04700 [Nostoc carneum NIES-2107]|nr:hypothetical protein NIES2107_04700 [Nostoc carneum NIES-2107]
MLKSLQPQVNFSSSVDLGHWNITGLTGGNLVVLVRFPALRFALRQGIKAQWLFMTELILNDH